MEQPESTSPAPRRRAIYLLPNLMTTAALFSGFYAIVAAIDGNFERAGIAVFVAMVFDTLDGRLARLTHTESAFGKEFDSLADMVSFGLAPAIVSYQWGVARIAEYGQAWGRFGWLAAFFYCAAAAMRLARFNTNVATLDKRYFQGLPSPSAAAVVMAFIWASSEWREPGLPGLILAFAVTAIAGALMVSNFGFPSFKKIDLNRPMRFLWLVAIPVVFVVIAADPPRALLVLFGSYALSAPLLWVVRRLGRRPRALAPHARPGAGPGGDAEKGE
jgi:CDP-diacylglycerol--serine O-phosphatidyltransferase